MALAETAELAIRINLSGNASTGIGRLNKQLGGLQQSVGRVGKGFGQIGAGLTRAGLLIGGAAVTGLTAAAKAAIDFEDAFAGVRKTVDEADLAKAGLSFEKLGESFRDMATEIPIAATEFARIGEIAGALGIKATDIEEFTRTVALMGVTTNLSSDEAADAFGRLGTILGLTGDDFTELADSIVALGNAGASTESEITEITKRFAAQAKQAGLTKEAMVALASVTAGLGFEPERGGTALARVFANIATNVSLANAKGKALSQGLGRSIKDLQSDIDKGKGLGIFLAVLEEIRGLKPTDAARFLDAIGVKNVSDRNIFLSMADQLPFVNEQLKLATEATGALSTEAQKRFDTIASKIQLFKNNLTEAGIVIGEGMLPAIGRATDKLIAFLRLPSTETDLTRLGEDIGKAIDGIDFDEVLRQGRELVGVMKGALSFAKMLFDAFNALPGPIKEATAGFLVLNKLSGGLISSGIGNIFGGLGETLVRGLGSKIPKVGSLFAQPVFVTNWPLGGFGGGAPGVGGAGGISALLKGALPVLLPLLAAAAVEVVRQDIGNKITRQAEGVSETNKVFLASNPTTEALRSALAGVDQGIADIQSNPLHVLVQGDALTKLQEMRADIAAQLAKQETGTSQENDPNKRGWRNADFNRQITAIENLKSAAVPALGNISDEVRTNAAIVEAAQARTAGETQQTILGSSAVTGALIGVGTATTRMQGTLTQSAVRTSASASASRIVGAIQRNRPITYVNVRVSATTVNKTTTVHTSYGPGGGSGDQNSRYGPVPT